MITHVVCFTLNDGVDAEECVAKLRTLADRVPQVRSLSTGVNVVASDRAYDVALIVTFDSRADLDAYQVDSYHQEVLAFLAPRRDKAVAVDFES